MAPEDEYFLTFSEWLFPGPGGLGALGWFAIWVPIVAVLGLLIGLFRSVLLYGPVEGFYAVARSVDTAVKDLVQSSPRRTLAMARLAIQESIRRWVLIVFAIFLLFVLFAGWFLDVRSDNPARLYMGFVLGMNNMLLILLALVLSTFSLPSDIRNRTIYTVVTKPVRAGEIVLGRVLGFTGVASVFLVAMCLISYVFVTRGLDHSHAVDPTTVVRDEGGEEPVVRGTTTSDAYHEHTFTVGPDGVGQTDVVQGHWHEVRREGDGPDAKYIVGPPREMLQARVADYGRLRFLGRTGKARERAYNVGKEWAYRSYIEGGTKSAAIWTFGNVTPERFPEGLPLEMNIRVFRTHKGDIEKGIVGLLKLRNPDPAANVESETFTFTAKEFQIDNLFIDRKLRAQRTDGTLREIDLFEDLVDEDGNLEVVVQCAEPAQYFGVAEGDVYLRARDSSFFLNFAKGHFAIWLQMFLVICFGVMFSTFLSGIIAMVATLATVVIGHTVDFIIELAQGESPGGGALESSFRIVRQMNVSAEIDANVGTRIVQATDLVTSNMVRFVANLVPNYKSLSQAIAEYGPLVNGFDISNTLLARQCVMTFGYALIVILIGYFFLKTREIAA